MKATIKALAVLILVGVAANPCRAQEEHRIGAGANYWVAVEDIDADDLDDSGLSYFVSYQYRPGLLGLEGAVEFIPNHFVEDAIAPQAYVILGSGIYVAAGIGILNVDGEFLDDPFYAFRAGLELELLPSIYIDLSASYRFSERSDLEEDETDIDTDTVFLGAAARLAL